MLLAMMSDRQPDRDWSDYNHYDVSIPVVKYQCLQYVHCVAYCLLLAALVCVVILGLLQFWVVTQ